MVTMTIDEIDAFIANSGKSLVGDIEWKTPRGDDRRFQFRRAVQYDNSSNREIEINIWCNTDAPTITIAYFVADVGRIYGFCLGVPHNNVLYHRHHGVRESEIITPLPDTVARLVGNPAAVWAKFCAETSLTHQGNFRNPPEEPWRPQTIEI